MSSTHLGTLYVVATPIGNLEDISARALKILQQVDLIAAEDTRHSAGLLQHYGINTPVLSLHQHNEAQRVESLIQRLQAGEQIALISDAGTPLLNDPGFLLVQAVRELKLPIVPIPGASAITTALSVAGVPTDRFLFVGFLPARATARQAELQNLAKQNVTLVIFESTHRILPLLQDIVQVLGATRQLVLARELTKHFETILAGTAAGLLQQLKDEPVQQRGEFVVLLPPIDAAPKSDLPAELEKTLELLLTEGLSVKQASRIAAKLLAVSRNAAYQAALVNKSYSESCKNMKINK